MSKSLLFSLLPSAWEWAHGKGNADERVPLPCRFTLVSDFGSVLEEGQGRLDDLPAAERLVWLLPESFVSFHRVTLPKLRAAQQRAALMGALEEQLLGPHEPQSLHFVLDGEAAGAARWVAVCERAPLLRVLARCEQAGRSLARIAPRLAPAQAPDSGSVFVSAHPLSAAISRTEGCALLPLHAALAMQLAHAQPAQQWRAQPAALAPLQKWLGNETTIQALSAAEQDLRALESAWDLSEGLTSDFWRASPSLRSLRRYGRGAMQVLRSPAWGMARTGMAALLLVCLLGLNIAAWRAHRWQQEAQKQITQLAVSALPELGGVILDLDLQSERLLRDLRLRAGVSAPGEMEWWLAQAAHFDAGAPEQIRFENGRMELSFANAQEAERLARNLADAGLNATLQGQAQIALSLDAERGRR